MAILKVIRKALRSRNEWSGRGEIICHGEEARMSKHTGRQGLNLPQAWPGEDVLTVRARQHSIQTSGSQSVLLEPAASASSWECVMNANSWVPSQTY